MGPGGRDRLPSGGACRRPDSRAFCRTLPNIACLAPKDEAELQAMLAWSLAQKQPVALRIPREQTPSLGPLPWHPIQLGKGELLAKGRHGAMFAYGVMTAKALEARAMLAKEGLDVAVAHGAVNLS